MRIESVRTCSARKASRLDGQGHDSQAYGRRGSHDYQGHDSQVSGNPGQARLEFLSVLFRLTGETDGPRINLKNVFTGTAPGPPVS